MDEQDYMSLEVAIIGIMNSERMREVSIIRDRGNFIFTCETQEDVYSFVLPFNEGMRMLTTFMKDEDIRLRIF